MTTYECVAVVVGLVGAGFIGYLLGVLGRPPVTVTLGSPPPPPPPAPIPGETWRMSGRARQSVEGTHVFSGVFASVHRPFITAPNAVRAEMLRAQVTNTMS